jgi:hypothetical protein
MKFQKNLLNLKIEKKHKYFIYAFLLGLFVFLFSYGNEDYKSAFAALAIFVSIFGVFFTQYPNVRLTNILVHLILPFHLTVGVLMSLIYFPNLSLLLRFGFICFYIFSLYILSLVNNVFLVVEDRRESIPLFRVALTWIQILIVLIAIPFFAGIFKLEINSLFQNIIVGFSSALFVSYLFWVFSMEKGTSKREIVAAVFGSGSDHIRMSVRPTARRDSTKTPVGRIRQIKPIIR